MKKYREYFLEDTACTCTRQKKNQLTLGIGGGSQRTIGGDGNRKFTDQVKGRDVRQDT